MENTSKVSLLDWRFKLGIFLLVLALMLLVISLILLPTAKFSDRFDSSLGNGFWAINNYGVRDLLFNWSALDDQAVVEAFSTHPFLQVFVALLFLLFLTPLFIIMGSALIVRWWVKTRI